MTTLPAYVASNTQYATNSVTTHSLTGIATGSWMLLAAAYSLSNETIVTPTGWTLLLGPVVMNTRTIFLFGKIKTSGDTSVTVTGSVSASCTTQLTSGTGGDVVANWIKGTGKLRATSPAETVTTTGLSATSTVANSLAVAISYEATSATEATAPVTSGTGWSNVAYSAQSGSTNIEQIRMSVKNMATAGATGNETDTYANSQATNGYAIQIIIPPIPAGNVAPTAGFSASVSGAVATVTSSATDSDGTIASTDYDWGDGTTHGATANTSHTYTPLGGTFTITQTVTDNGGLTATTTHSVTIAAQGYPGIWRDSSGVNHPGVLFYWDGTTKRLLSGTTVKIFTPTTVTEFLSTKRAPWFGAHRGFSFSYPEETLYSYKGATDWGIKAIEVSVQYSSDGTPWCFHDTTTDRTTGVSGTIASMTDAQLVVLSNMGSTAGGNSSQPSRPVAKLVDVLNLYYKTHVIIIEDKSYSHTTSILNLMDSYGATGRPATDIFIWKVDATAGGTTFFTPASSRGYHIWGYIFDASMSTDFTTAVTSGKMDMMGMDFNSTDSTLTAAVAACIANNVRPTGHIIASATIRDRMLGLGMTGLMMSSKDAIPPWYLGW